MARSTHSPILAQYAENASSGTKIHMDGEVLRQAVLEEVARLSARGSELQSGSVLQAAAQRLGIIGISVQDTEHQQALLTFWHDLFRSGYLAWGLNLSNPSPPFCHLTEQGRQALSHISRDPLNPSGYLSSLRSRVTLSDIVNSYIEEALRTWNADCYKATAVMIGVASESMILEIRDVLSARMDSLGQTKPADLMHWIVKKVLDAIEGILGPKKSAMDRDLADVFEAYWPAFTQQIRTIRNDTGHPKSADPVRQDSVHAALLIFPELASLAERL